jgi:glycosyltransferase involved in cell wall biosynthesis
VQVILNAVELPAKQDDRSQQRVELRQELGLALNAPIALTVGRLTKQKGQTYLLQAIPAVLRACPEAALVFVGDGPLKLDLQAEARQLRVAERVHFLGLRQDVSKLLQAADIFVLPSLWEGMSMALLEAMAEGVPVVASDVEGINDLITDQVEGLVVPPRNPDMLAKAITSLLGNEDLREQLSQAAYEKVQREFSLERMSKQYENVFWGLLKNRTAPL